jgi:hypothetical protein
MRTVRFIESISGVYQPRQGVFKQAGNVTAPHSSGHASAIQTWMNELVCPHGDMAGAELDARFERFGIDPDCPIVVGLGRTRSRGVMGQRNG